MRFASVVAVLMAVGTITAKGQVPKAPAQGGQATPVPLYPSATFDAQTSAAMSVGGDSFRVYVTTDPAAKVVAFYTAKTGKKVQKLEEGSFAFFLAGGPLPDLTIQSNLLGEFAGKTVITVVKFKS
jgi:hypothetical protein